MNVSTPRPPSAGRRAPPWERLRSPRAKKLRLPQVPRRTAQRAPRRRAGCGGGSRAGWRRIAGERNGRKCARARAPPPRDERRAPAPEATDRARRRSLLLDREHLVEDEGLGQSGKARHHVGDSPVLGDAFLARDRTSSPEGAGAGSGAAGISTRPALNGVPQPSAAPPSTCVSRCTCPDARRDAQRAKEPG